LARLEPLADIADGRVGAKRSRKSNIKIEFT
jgi:hypothetical protein